MPVVVDEIVKPNSGALFSGAPAFFKNSGLKPFQPGTDKANQILVFLVQDLIGGVLPG